MTQHHEPRLAALSRAGSGRVGVPTEPTPAPTSDAPAPTSARTSAALKDSFSGLDHSSIMGTELMSAIVLWTGLGWLVDRWLGTSPWFLVVGGLIGNFAGLYLIWLRSGRMDEVERRKLQARRSGVAADPLGAVAAAVRAGRTGIPTSARADGVHVPMTGEQHVER